MLCLRSCAVWSGAALSAIDHARFCCLIRYFLTYCEMRWLDHSYASRILHKTHFRMTRVYKNIFVSYKWNILAQCFSLENWSRTVLFKANWQITVAYSICQVRFPYRLNAYGKHLWFDNEKISVLSWHYIISVVIVALSWQQNCVISVDR